MSERDAWLAEKVGWKKSDRVRNYYLRVDPKGLSQGRNGIPAYTTNLAAAMGLLNDMRERRWDWTISCLCTLHDAYEVSLVAPCNNESRVRATDHDLVAAICEAVWLALGGE